MMKYIEPKMKVIKLSEEGNLMLVACSSETTDTNYFSNQRETEKNPQSIWGD